MTKIIVAYAGTGKSKATEMLPQFKLRDSDSSEFRYVGHHKDGVENPQWPQNFIDHARIELERDWYDAILMSAYIQYLPDIITATPAPITFVYPSLDMKDEFGIRYRTRYANNERNNKLAEFFIGKFDEWVTALASMQGEHVVLQPGQYLSDVLPGILARP